MNRRNFLKATGLIGLLGISNISFAKNKKELKWISLKDELPKKGQKIILADKNHMTLGVIQKLCKESEWYKSFIIVYKNTDISIFYGNNNKCSLYTEKGKELLKTKKWLGFNSNSEVLDYTEYGDLLNKTYTKHGIHYGKNCYWIPVYGEYPDEIPNFPAK